MKLRNHDSFPSDGGSVLLLTLVTASIIGVTLAAYLKMVEQQNLSVMRAMTWNAGIPAAEAGIEEAIAHLNTVGDGARNTNGWTLVSDGVTLSRALDADSRFVVSISTSTPPVVTAVGYTKVPLGTSEIVRRVRVNTTKTSTGFRGIVARGGVELVGNIKMDSFDSTDPNLSTYGRYDPAKARDKGFVGSVLSSITGGGGKVHGSVGTGPKGSASDAGTVGDTAWHTNGNTGIQPGHYANDLNVSFPDVMPPEGPFLTPSGGTVTITNFEYVSSTISTNAYPAGFSGPVSTNTGPYTSYTYPSPAPTGPVTTNTAFTSSTSYPASGAYVGTVTTRTVTSGPPDKRGTWYDYYKITGYTYETTVYTYSITETNTSTVTENYTYVLDSDKYELSSLSLGSNQKVLVRGNATLYISGTSGEVFSMTGNSEILILPGASLTVYCAGDAKLAGNGVHNGTNNALNYAFKGLPTCRNIKLDGNAAFTGVIYAPRSYLLAGGGGSDVYDCVGAAIVGTAKFNGHFNFHYDEMLGNQGGATRWNVASWDEF